MKKLLFTAFLSLLVLGVSAQKKTLKSAQKSLNKKEYDMAIQLATEASNNPETQDNPDVYMILGQATMYNFNAGGNTDLAMAQQSYDYFMKAVEKGTAKTKEKVFEDVVLNPATGLRLGGGEGARYLEIFVVSQAGKHFEAGEYGDSYGFYELASKIVDDVIYDFYAGFCAYSSDRTEEAEKYYTTVLEKDPEFENANFVYNGLIDIYNQREDWDNALKYIAQAKEKYPEERVYSEYETEVLMRADRLDEAIDQLNKVVSQAGATERDWFNLAYLQFNNGAMEEAKAAAEGALKIKPDYVDALYIAGSVPFNKAVELGKQANNETDNDKYDKLHKESLEFYKKAQPYFEKAVELKEEEYVLTPLSAIYDQLGMADKRDAILKRIEALEGN